MPAVPAPAPDFDYVIVGSGFGGGVSALRLAEKGWRVLVVERGRRFAAEDFAKDNTELRRWYWLPRLGMTGIFAMSFLQHVTVLHGVGYGGGSLVYANTLPVPDDEFFAAPSWSALADWKRELAPHYATAGRMLGAVQNPVPTRGDDVLHQIAKEMGREHDHEPTRVGVFFGAPGVEVADPYFDGEGPRRTGCTLCGACMTGCRVGAKNTLDKNYLFFAELRGARVKTEANVVDVAPRAGGGYAVALEPSLRRGAREVVHARNVIFAGGVMGTIPLLLRLRETSLPALSPRVGDFVRTNNEALIGVLTPNAQEDLARGVAITSIFKTDAHSHVEPVRYGAGSTFFRQLALPHAPREQAGARLAGAFGSLLRDPVGWARAYAAEDFAKQSQILLYMRALESTLSLRLARSLRHGGKRGLVSRLDDAASPPRAFMPEASELAEKFADKIGGKVLGLLTEALLGVPSTAHILGGACMGVDASSGVIDHAHRVFGYDGLYVIDGSAVSANPGVNPSLTITALAERAMSLVPTAR